MRFGRFSYTLALSSLLVGSSALADIQAGLDALDAGDVAVAATEFQSAFQDGNGDGAFYLGRLFEFGLGAEKDMTRAANLYAAAAEAGSVNAMNRLGLLYLEGTTLLKDYALARENFCKAAEIGDQNGQLNCALMLKEGRGGEAEIERAAELLQAAGDQGNIAAKNLLAAMYQSGDGVAEDMSKAMVLFNETADAGNAMGLFEVAKYHGVGTSDRAADYVKAYAFANLAAVRNMAAALEYRDQLEESMTEEEIAAAQRLSQEWTAERIASQVNQGQN